MRAPSATHSTSSAGTSGTGVMPMYHAMPMPSSGLLWDRGTPKGRLLATSEAGGRRKRLPVDNAGAHPLFSPFVAAEIALIKNKESRMAQPLPFVSGARSTMATSSLHAALPLDPFSPGPTADDPDDWQAVPAARQNQLLLTGERNDKMNSYLAQIRRKNASERSQLEQWTVTLLVINEMNQEITGPPPPPIKEPPPNASLTRLWVQLTAAACFLLLLFMSWRRNWGNPFGTCVMIPPAPPK